MFMAPFIITPHCTQGECLPASRSTSLVWPHSEVGLSREQTGHSPSPGCGRISGASCSMKESDPKTNTICGAIRVTFWRKHSSDCQGPGAGAGPAPEALAVVPRAASGSWRRAHGCPPLPESSAQGNFKGRIYCM